MARQIGRLSALAVAKAKAKGMYPDGGGLYLQVTESGAKSWIYRFTLDGRAREMGLGPVHTIALAEARDRATACRKMRLEGIDPIEARKKERADERLLAASATTFDHAAERYVNAHRAGWRNAKHADQFRNTLKAYVTPVFGALPVQAVTVDLVLKALEPIWYTKTETATRVRQRIEAVLDWATSRDLRRGDNPARWKGHLENLLPRRAKVRRVQHHAALPYDELPAFMARLRAQEGVATSALEFVILTATRTSETIGATWDEIDLGKAVWTIPSTRIKAGREHRVPLSGAAMSILRRMLDLREGEHVFPGGKARKPLSNMAMAKVLERMGRDDVTVHGFRSTFRDWAAERTNFPREVAEMALAYVVSDKVEAAYRRGDLFDKRRELMEAWSVSCSVFAITGGMMG
ncbi:tyrosine-type recombinase/integrase [Arenibaculum sp.]|jgi:integrase|uniref:tyrosine-type recombinase/integrase n=1 Tax=Arenibaculum sp. TaxID=2865862 RepID=UPI002E10E34E|nr:integrase arm-type DNA-binding domain-containing protein [Arenibaculum sp.]